MVVKLATAAKVAPPCTMLASTLQVKQKLSSSYWIILRTFDYLWGGPKEILVPILQRFKSPDLDLYSSQNQLVETFLYESDLKKLKLSKRNIIISSYSF